ncbi:hypothetical protein BJY52DRAFT_1227802 [Lactarius psammicola]|nr:hypothetical protein BJY52DRAFT_1227802 [Lactarius psammicola]
MAMYYRTLLSHPQLVTGSYKSIRRVYLCQQKTWLCKRGERVAQGVPAHLQAFTSEDQENYNGIFGYAPTDPAVDHPQYFPGPEALPYHMPLPNAPLADGLRNLAGHYINNPGAHVNMIHIEPGPAGCFEVLIMLEMVDILCLIFWNLHIHQQQYDTATDNNKWAGEGGRVTNEPPLVLEEWAMLEEITEAYTKEQKRWRLSMLSHQMLLASDPEKKMVVLSSVK